MIYFYSKSKFSWELFYKKIEHARIEHTSGVFQVQILPYFNYAGKFNIHSVVQKDRKRTIFLTMRDPASIVDFNNLNPFNKYYISMSHDGKKAMIYQDDARGIILKS